MSKEPSAELAALLSDLIDGTLTDDSHARLEQILANDADARAFYRDYIQVVAGVHWRWHGAAEVPNRAAADGGNPSKADPPLHPSLSTKRPPGAAVSGWVRDFAREPVALALLLFAMLSGGVLAWQLSKLPTVEPHVSQRVQPPSSENGEPRALARGGSLADREDLTAPESSEPGHTAKTSPGADAAGAPVLETGSPIAKLVRSVGAVWESTQAPADGASLTTGQKLVLQRGLAEIAFDSGATVILEGPAELEIGGRKSEIGHEGSGVRGQASDTSNACGLTLGKLVAHVPQQAQGFTVHTPRMNIIDLGTEFGVIVKAEVGARTSDSMPSPTSDLQPPTSTEVQVFQGKVTLEPPTARVAQVPESATGNRKTDVLTAGQGVIANAKSGALRLIEASPTTFVRELPATPPTAALATWPKDSPLLPGDIVAVTAKSMKVIRIDPKSGEQTLLTQGIPYLSGPVDHGVAWHCLALAPDGTLLAGFDGQRGKEAGIVRIDLRSKKIRTLAVGGLLTSGAVCGLAVAADGSIQGVYEAYSHGQAAHLIRVDPKSGSVSSLARLHQAQGMCLDRDGRSALVVVLRPGAVTRLEAGTVTPWVSGIQATSCHTVAIAPNGRVFVASILDSAGGVRALLEVDGKTGAQIRTVCQLPQAPRTDLPWEVAVEADGMVVAGPAEGDRHVYRIHPDSGKFQILSSGGMLEDRTMLAVVPGGKSKESK